jgi:hypothetical protein
VTLFIWWRQYHRSSGNAAQQKQEAENPAPSEKDLYKRLLKACGDNEASTAGKLLFLWGKARYPSIDSTRALARTSGCDDLVHEIDTLESSLYSSSTNGAWRGARLANLVAQIKHQEATQKRKPALLGTLNPAA